MTFLGFLGGKRNFSGIFELRGGIPKSSSEFDSVGETSPTSPGEEESGKVPRPLLLLRTSPSPPGEEESGKVPRPLLLLRTSRSSPAGNQTFYVPGVGTTPPGT